MTSSADPDSAPDAAALPAPEQFIRPSAEPSTAAIRAERRAAVLSLVVGVSLMAIKFVAYILTGSSAIFSDAIESIVNVVASGFALWAISYAHRPADRSHPYGHGKVEFFSAGLEGAMIAVAAIVIALRAISQLYHGPVVSQIEWGLALIALAMVINGIVGLYLIRHGKQSGSIALEADGHHLMSDAVTSAVVLVALILVRQTGWAMLDPIVALVMSLYIGFMGFRLVRRSAAGLMDEQDPADERAIRAILDAHVGPAGQQPAACSYHKLRHRHSGRYHWIDFHLVVPADWDIARAHECASYLENEIENRLTHADATAHIEPCMDLACRRCRGTTEAKA